MGAGIAAGPHFRWFGHWRPLRVSGFLIRRATSLPRRDRHRVAMPSRRPNIAGNRFLPIRRSLARAHDRLSACFLSSPSFRHLAIPLLRFRRHRQISHPVSRPQHRIAPLSYPSSDILKLSRKASRTKEIRVILQKPMRKICGLMWIRFRGWRETGPYQRDAGSQPGGARVKPANSKPGVTVQLTSAHPLSASAACQ
jgi:hypothetical protein